jgi:hypothetical protein
MRRIIFVLALVGAIIALVSAAASAQEKKPATTKLKSVKTTEVEHGATKVPPGKVLVDEELLIGFVDEPAHHFGLARDYFMKKDYADAATEIRRAGGFVKLEMARAEAQSDDERVLSDAVVSLGMLADDVQKGEVKSADRLDDVFAHTEQALAYHHELKAEEYWKAENHKSAGQDLRAATVHLENSMSYAGEKTEKDTDEAIRDARDIGDKLADGAALAADKVGKAMQQLGKKIEEAGRKMKQERIQQKK